MTVRLLSLLDPDDIYPACLAGSHAWAQWGLAPNPGPWDDIRLVVPFRIAGHTAPILAEEITRRMSRPQWPPLPDLRVQRDRTLVHATVNDEKATIEVTSHPWYISDDLAPASAMVVTAEGWPVIDEVSAVRERLERVARVGVRDSDITDIARWLKLKAEGATARSTGTQLGALLNHLRQHAPKAYAALTDIRSRARTTAAVHETERLVELFSFLDREGHRIERSRRAVVR